MLVTALGLSGCGQKKAEPPKKAKSMTESAFEGIDPKRGMRLVAEVSEGGRKVEMDMHMKGENIYIKTVLEGQEVIFLKLKEVFYTLIPSYMQGYKTDMKAVGMPDLNKIGDIKKIIKKSKIEKGSTEIDGITYKTESIKDPKKGEISQICFDKKGKFKYLIIMGEDGKEKIRIAVKSLDNKVDKKLFKLPEGYKIQDMANPPSLPI